MMFLNCISELMLSTLIQIYDKKNHFILIQFKTERLTEIYRLSDATFYDHINTIYQYIKPFLDKKNVFFLEYGALSTLLFLCLRFRFCTVGFMNCDIQGI